MSQYLLQQILSHYVASTTILFWTNTDISFYTTTLEHLHIDFLENDTTSTKTLSLLVFIQDCLPLTIMPLISKHKLNIITTYPIIIPKSYKIHKHNLYTIGTSPYQKSTLGFAQSHYLLNCDAPLTNTDQVLNTVIPQTSKVSDEEIYQVAYLYRQNNKHALALKWLTYIKTPSDELNIKIQEIYSISCYYIGQRDQGYRACQDLCANGKFNNRNLALGNLRFYILPLKSLATLSLHCNLPLLKGYVTSNTSCIQMPNGYRACVRSVNYTTDKPNCFNSTAEDGSLRSQNYLLNYNEQLELQNVVPLSLSISINIHLYPHNVRGLEDVRLFGSQYFLATCLQFYEQRIPQIGWGTYDDLGLVTKLVPLKVAANFRCEKNWLPFMINDEIYFIYQIAPLKIYHLVEDRCVLYHEGNIFPAVDIRGSSPPILWDNGWLFVGHEVHESVNGRIYYHRFCWLSKDYQQGKWSDLFYFEHLSVEFNLSITPYLQGFILTYTVKDTRPQLLYCSEQEIRYLLIHQT